MSTDSRSATRDPLLCLMITGVLTTALLFATVLPIGGALSDGGPDVHRHSWTGAMPDSAGDGSTPSAGSPPSWPAGPVPAGGSAQGGGLVSGRPSPPDVAGVSIEGASLDPFPNPILPGGDGIYNTRHSPWTRQFASGAGVAWPGMAIGSTGVYVVAWFRIVKYSFQGDLLWIRELGAVNGTGGPRDPDVRAYALEVDASGVYVAGTVEGAFPGQTSLGSGDAFVAKFDAEGNLMWVRQFGSEAAEGASAISLSASGVYVAGNTGVTKKWLDEFNYTYIGRNDAFLRKFDRSGDTVWTREITSLGIDWIDCATGVANDATGVYVAGMTDGTLSSPEPQQGLRPDAFVRKYDADGNELWTRQFGSVTHAQDAAYGVAADGTGVYVAGRTQGVYTGETAYGNSDGFLRKYDSQGIEMWTRQFGNVRWDSAFGVATDSRGIYVVGESYGSEWGLAYYDALVWSFSPLGVLLEANRFGTSKDDSARGVLTTPSNLYIVGWTLGVFPGQPPGNIFLAKIRQR